MAGSDRVLTRTIQSEPRLETRKPSTRAKWRSSTSAYTSVLENVLDTADIVRDPDFSPTEAHRSFHPQLRNDGASRIDSRALSQQPRFDKSNGGSNSVLLSNRLPDALRSVSHCRRCANLFDRLCEVIRVQSLSFQSTSRNAKPLQLCTPEILVSHMSHDDGWASSKKARLRCTCAAVMNHQRTARKHLLIGRASYPEDLVEFRKSQQIIPRHLENSPALCQPDCLDPDVHGLSDVVQLIQHHAAECHVHGRLACGKEPGECSGDRVAF